MSKEAGRPRSDLFARLRVIAMANFVSAQCGKTDDALDKDLVELISPDALKLRERLSVGPNERPQFFRRLREGTLNGHFAGTKVNTDLLVAALDAGVPGCRGCAEIYNARVFSTLERTSDDARDWRLIMDSAQIDLELGRVGWERIPRSECDAGFVIGRWTVPEAFRGTPATILSAIYCERATSRAAEEIAKSLSVLDALAIFVDLFVESSVLGGWQEHFWRERIDRVLESTAFVELFGDHAADALALMKGRIAMRAARAFGLTSGLNADRAIGAVVRTSAAVRQRLRWSIETEGVQLWLVLNKEFEKQSGLSSANGLHCSEDMKAVSFRATAPYESAMSRLRELAQLENGLGSTSFDDQQR